MLCSFLKVPFLFLFIFISLLACNSLTLCLLSIGLLASLPSRGLTLLLFQLFCPSLFASHRLLMP